MEPNKQSDAASRRAVTERLRRFFAELTAQLSAGTTEIWSRVERPLAHHLPKREPGDDAPYPSTRPRRSMQQPMQQQQSNAKPEEEK